MLIPCVENYRLVDPVHDSGVNLRRAASTAVRWICRRTMHPLHALGAAGSQSAVDQVSHFAGAQVES